MTFCQCVCVCVCVCVHLHMWKPCADYFNVDTHPFGRRRSIEHLDRQANSVSNRPTTDPRKGCQEVGPCRPPKGKYQQHGLGRQIP